MSHLGFRESRPTLSPGRTCRSSRERRGEISARAATDEISAREARKQSPAGTPTTTLDPIALRLLGHRESFRRYSFPGDGSRVGLGHLSKGRRERFDLERRVAMSAHVSNASVNHPGHQVAPKSYSFCSLHKISSKGDLRCDPGSGVGERRRGRVLLVPEPNLTEKVFTVHTRKQYFPIA